MFAVEAHADGRIGVGGDFTVFNGQALRRLARLNADGSVDFGFEPGAGPNDAVLALKIEPDSAVVIGGRFTEVDGLPRNHVARIHGDEKFSLGILHFTAATYPVNENAGTITLVLRRSGNLKGGASVQYATRDGSATAGADYQPASGTLDFGPGEIEKSLTLTIFDDALGEGNETFVLTLTDAAGVELTDRDAATVLIVDDEAAVAFSAVARGPDPAPDTVQITNTGGSTLGDLIVDAVEYVSGAPGWLDATLSGASATNSCGR